MLSEVSNEIEREGSELKGKSWIEVRRNIDITHLIPFFWFF